MTDKMTRIVVAGRLGECFSEGFASGAGDVTQHHEGPNTVLEGRGLDEAQVHGLLNRLRDLGIEIVSLARTAQAQ